MTDKTIIDGIDVSECNWCDFEPNAEPYCRINDGEDLNCEDNKDCYFKQLARAKEELQAKEHELIMTKADLCRGCQYKNDYKAKEQECENLKDKVAQIKCEEIGKETFWEYRIKKYQQVLDEIEELCKDHPFCDCGCGQDILYIITKQRTVSNGINNNSKQI